MGQSAHYSFGPFRLDAVHGPLTRNGEAIKLPRKALALLWTLAGRAGQVVTRQALFDAVWPGVIVSGDALEYQVGAVRRALGDNAREPEYIQTVHGVGFRFIAAAQESAASAVPDSATHESHPYFVGRAEALSALDATFARAVRGQRQMVFVCGEAGIGKTSLVQAFLRRTAGPPLTTGQGQCMVGETVAESFHPVLEALRHLCQSPDGEWVIPLLRETAPTALVQFAGVLGESEYTRLRRRVAGATPARVLRELADALETLAAERPLLLVIEDLHFSDAATRDLLAALTRRGASARLMILVTMRLAEPGQESNPPQKLKQHLIAGGHAAEIYLDGLAPHEVELYLYRRYGVLHDPTLSRTLYRYTEGQPLFMVHTAEQMVGRQHAAPDPNIEGFAPERLQAVIAARIASLDENSRALLDCAAVVGNEFTAAALAAALDGPLKQAEAGCDALARRGQFLAAEGTQRWPDDTLSGRFRFRHHLYRQAFLERVPAVRASRIQARVARREERAYAGHTASIAGRLADRYGRAAVADKAVEYRLLAARTALERAAPLDVVAHTRAGLAQLESMPGGAARDRAELGLLLYLVSTGTLTGGIDSARVQTTNERIERLLSVTHAPALHAQALSYQWAAHHMRADGEQAMTYADRLSELGQGTGTGTWEGAGLSRGSITLHIMGRHQESERYSQRALELVPDARDTGIGDDRAHPSVLALVARSLTRWMLGFPEQSLEFAHEATARARATTNPLAVCVAYGLGVSVTQLYRREPAKLLETCNYAMALCEQYGYSEGLAVAAEYHAIAWCLNGQGDQGLRRLRQIIAARQASGLVRGLTVALAHEAEYCVATGRYAEAQSALNTAFSAARDNEERVWEPELWRTQGDLAWAARRSRRGGERTALQAYEQAVMLAREQGARSLELRAATHWARARDGQGRRDAFRLLRAVYQQFTEGFDSPDLKSAAVMLNAH